MAKPVLFKKCRCRGEAVEKVRFVTIQWFVEKNQAVIRRASGNNNKCFGEKLQCLGFVHRRSMFALHRTEDGGGTQSTAQIDERENEIQRVFPNRGVRIGERQAVFHHARSGAECGDVELMTFLQFTNIPDGHIIRRGQKQLHRVKSMRGGFFKTNGQFIVKHKRTRGGLAHAAKCHCAFHRLMDHSDSTMMLP